MRRTKQFEGFSPPTSPIWLATSYETSAWRGTHCAWHGLTWEVLSFPDDANRDRCRYTGLLPAQTNDVAAKQESFTEFSHRETNNEAPDCNWTPAGRSYAEKDQARAAC